MKNFWQELPKPFFALAPMEDVTDTVFRQIVASVGRPHVFFTEFTNVEGICHWMATSLSAAADPPLLYSGEGRGEVLIQRLIYSDLERPIVAQIWGNNPDKFYEAAKLIKELNFDGIDINFGCPERNIVKQGSCSALIGQETLVDEIIKATLEGGGGLPVSVKTRIGRKEIVTDKWVGFLLTQQLAAITIHGRTAVEMSDVPAHWDEIAKAVRLRNQSKFKTLIIGNGDVVDLESAKCLVLSAKVDGVMIGRGIFANPALFSGITLSDEQQQKLFIKHIQLFDETWGKSKNFQILKKFVKTYISGFEGATEVRLKLMQAQDCKSLVKMVEEI